MFLLKLLQELHFVKCHSKKIEYIENNGCLLLKREFEQISFWFLFKLLQELHFLKRHPKKLSTLKITVVCYWNRNLNRFLFSFNTSCRREIYIVVFFLFVFVHILDSYTKYILLLHLVKHFYMENLFTCTIYFF